MTGDELTALLTKARTYNRSHAITGMLIYIDGSFLQILEGEPSAVLALNERIKSDPRHSGVINMLSRTISQRAFADWSMGFKEAADLSEPEQQACAALFATRKGPANAITTDHVAEIIVRSFITNNLAH